MNRFTRAKTALFFLMVFLAGIPVFAQTTDFSGEWAPNGNEDSTPKDFKDLGNGWVEVDGTKIQRTRYEREQRQQNTVR